MSPLWTWPELCEALELPIADGPDVTGISFDSRRTRPGDLFFALTGDPGPRFNPGHRSDNDGHDYIEAAFAAGAVGVVAHDGVERTGTTGTGARRRPVAQLHVTDTLDALWALGAAARRRLDCPVVAVTGSSGKTTAKGFLSAALGAFSAAGSLNNHIGVPLSLALTPRDAGAAVYELGTNHPGEIGPLARLVRPNVAVVLNVHPAHRENFPSMDALRREKLSIHEGLTRGGRLVLEESLPRDLVPPSVNVVTFGRNAGSNARLLRLEDRKASCEVGGRALTVHVPGGGEHRAATLCAVLCVLEALGRDLDGAARLSDELIVAGRGREHDVAHLVLVDDSYNANPASMRAALTTLAARPARRRVALLGEMLELGDEGPAFHRELAAQAAQLDAVYCVGEGMRPLFDALPASVARGFTASADDALAEQVVAGLEAGDVLLVKGSNRVFWARDFVGTLLKRLREKPE